MVKKYSFQSVLVVVEKLKSYISFSDQNLCQLEVEFLSRQFITLDNMSEEVLPSELLPSGDEKHAVIYWINQVLVDQNFITCSNLVRVVLCTIHSNTEEEFVFSPVKKNLTPQGAFLELD